MNTEAARVAIEAILAAISDDELPDFDEVERRDGQVIVWFADTGNILGSAKTNGERDPLSYRRNAAYRAVELEMTCRADQRLLANGDDPTGVHLARTDITP